MRDKTSTETLKRGSQRVGSYPAAPRRILIIRPDHLGDLILFSGGLRHIRNKWPSARITLCVRSYGMELFANCPFIDKLQPYESLIPLGKIDWPSWFPGDWFRSLASAIVDQKLLHAAE